MKFHDGLLRPDANNLTLVRLILASSVIYTHCYELVAGVRGRDGLSWILGDTVAVYAVDGFFFLSGFLVYPSLIRLGKTGPFLLARLTRLWPALALSIGLTVAGGLAVTTAPGLAYFHGDTATFIGGNLSLQVGAYTLTGVQCGSAPCDVNGSLWTLPWEARCYLLLAVLGLAGLAQPKRMLWFILPATLVAAIVWEIHGVHALAVSWLRHGLIWAIDTFHRMWTLFALGIAAYLLRARLPLSWGLLVVLFAVNLGAHALGAGLFGRALFIGYGVLCLGMRTARTKSLSSGWPDYSYGMYIYAFPVMMVVDEVWPQLGHWPLTAATVAVTLPLAALSWHMVEQPALNAFRRYRREAALATVAKSSVHDVRPVS